MNKRDAGRLGGRETHARHPNHYRFARRGWDDANPTPAAKSTAMRHVRAGRTARQRHARSVQELETVLSRYIDTVKRLHEYEAPRYFGPPVHRTFRTLINVLNEVRDLGTVDPAAANVLFDQHRPAIEELSEHLEATELTDQLEPCRRIRYSNLPVVGGGWISVPSFIPPVELMSDDTRAELRTLLVMWE